MFFALSLLIGLVSGSYLTFLLGGRGYIRCDIEDLKSFNFDFLDPDHMELAQYAIECSLHESDTVKLLYILNLEEKKYHFIFYHAVISALNIERPQMLRLILDTFPGRLLHSSILQYAYKKTLDDCTVILLQAGVDRFVHPFKCIRIAAETAEAGNDPLILTNFLAPNYPRTGGIVLLLEKYILDSKAAFREAILHLPCFMCEPRWQEMTREEVKLRRQVRRKVEEAISKDKMAWLKSHLIIIDLDFAVHFLKLAIKSNANKALEFLLQMPKISFHQIDELLRTVTNSANADALLIIFHQFYPENQNIPFIHSAIKTCDYLRLSETVSLFMKAGYKPTYDEITQMMRIHRDFAVALVIPLISRHLSYPFIFDILPIAFKLKKTWTIKAILRLIQDAPRFHSTRRLVFDNTFGKHYHMEPDVATDLELIQLMTSAVDFKFRLNHHNISELHNILENRMNICAGTFYLLVTPFEGDEFDLAYNQFTHFSGNSDALLEHIVSAGSANLVDKVIGLDPDLFLLEPITGLNLIESAPETKDGLKIKRKLAGLMWDQLRAISKLDVLLLGHLFDASSALHICGFRDVISHLLNVFLEIEFEKRRSKMLKFF